jgi:hypothetical protein
MRRSIWIVAVALSTVAACSHKPAPTPTPAPAPSVTPSEYTTTVDNPFFPLRTGMTWQYRSRTADGLETTIVTVTGATHTIMGVACVEVRDTVRLDGTVIEDTLDWYAQSRDGSVWYFGEDTKEYENGKVSSTKGSWMAGVNGAEPGVLMPGQPQVGAKYRQEYLKGEAEDMAEVLSITAAATVPTGSYTGMVQTKETTPLEPAALENKYYARGIGPVLTVDVAAGGVRDELTAFTS